MLKSILTLDALLYTVITSLGGVIVKLNLLSSFHEIWNEQSFMPSSL